MYFGEQTVNQALNMDALIFWPLSITMIYKFLGSIDHPMMAL
jgi:hypothetical protein